MQFASLRATIYDFATQPPDPVMSDHIRTLAADGIVEVTIDRPDKKNALDQPMYRALAGVFDRAAADPALRVVLLTGSNGVFCAGNDIADFAGPHGPDTSQTERLIESVLRFTKPVVAAIDGLAVGIGTTILLHCDLVFATASARFILPFVELGLVPEFASSLLLPRLMGLQRASEILLLGDPLSAAAAREAGLVNRIVADADLLPAARDACRRLAAKPPEALAIARRLLRGDPDAAIARAREEATLFATRLASPEARAAFAAFLSRSRRS
jgi:enoyl-CoA hydratase/carnithine racemase